MFPFHLRHVPTDTNLARIARLNGFWRKGQGVIGLKALAPGEGVWLPQAGAVHTCFVSFPLDILFLDGEYRTLAAYSHVMPWRLFLGARGAQHTLEMGAGTLARLPGGVGAGDLWELYTG